MRLRLSAALLAVCVCVSAADEVTVDSVVATVRTSLRKKRKDAELAATLGQVRLSQRLEDRVLEILESEGAGPQAMGALQHLRDVSRPLPVPAIPPPGMTPPPPPSAVEERKVWVETRTKARDYMRSLPDFVCSETVHRWVDTDGREQWQPTPTIVADLTFFEQKEAYKVVSFDGKPTDKSITELGGSMSQGEFGSLLGAVFDPASSTDYRWDHWTILRKRPTAVFFYRIAADRGPNLLMFTLPEGKTVSTFAGQRGYVYIDRETNTVTRLAEEAEDIPAGFPVQKSSAVLDYDYINIGEARFLLPLRAEVHLEAGKQHSLNTVEFTSYRKFSSATAITFGGTDGKK